MRSWFVYPVKFSQWKKIRLPEYVRPRGYGPFRTGIHMRTEAGRLLDISPGYLII
jgi:hypothetical protein